MKTRVVLSIMVLLLHFFAGAVWGFTEGKYNNYFGASAGASSTTGDWNTLIGGAAGRLNTTGSRNTFVGMSTGLKNIDGSINSFMGFGAGSSNTSGGGNTFLGSYAGDSNTSGSGNTFLGSYAGKGNFTGSDNVIIGFSAGGSNGSGTRNIFIGYAAGASETGSHKLYIDNCNLKDDDGKCTIPLIYGEFDKRIIKINGSLTATDGIKFMDGSTQTVGLAGLSNGSNSFFGQGAGKANNKGYGNTFLGQVAGQNNDVGQYNTFLGHQTGVGNTTGNNNTFIGSQAGAYNKTGSSNVFIGYLAGYEETGSDKLYIANSKTPTPLIYGDFSGSVVTINGKLGVGTINPVHVIHLSGGAYSDGAKWVDGSSREYKENIGNLSVEEAVEALNGLNPVKFTYRSGNFDQHVGFIAEDVPDLVATRDRKGLSPMDIIAVLTKVVQEKSAAIDNLAAKLERLESEMNRLKNKDLTARIAGQ